MLCTVAEMPEYMRRASGLLSEEERKAVINHLAAHTNDGVLMTGTGGIRKLRWGRSGQGKSGGVRVIYYYHDGRLPLYLLTLFGKNEQPNLSKAQRNDLAKLVELLVRIGLEKRND